MAIQRTRTVKGFTLMNEQKFITAAEGDIANGGKFPGVGYENEDAILAEYDRRGGLIVQIGEDTDEEGNPVKISRKIATGAFYDFAKRCPRKEPLVKFEKPKPPRPPVTQETVGNEKKGKKIRKIDEATDALGEE